MSQWLPLGKSVFAGVAMVLVGSSAARADTAAGTTIVNVARLSYANGAASGTVDSNENRLIVAERLDVALAAGPTGRTGDAGSVVAAILTNRGNGQEAFAITAATAPDGQLIRIAIDSDGDGRYDSARDAELSGGRTPLLAPGQSVSLFAVVAATAGAVTITAAAATGSGAPGTSFPAAGDGGGDAVVGASGASASVTVPLARAAGASPTLAKSATVLAPDGSAGAVRGAVITYTLVASFPAAAEAALLIDPIPAGTAYSAASLTLDDAPLTDAADTDAGDTTPARIAVALGDQPAGAVRAIRFKVIIQ